MIKHRDSSKGISLVELMLVIFLLGLMSLAIIKLTAGIRENELGYEKLEDAQIATFSALTVFAEHAKRAETYIPYLQESFYSYTKEGQHVRLLGCFGPDFRRYCDYYTKPRVNCQPGYSALGGTDLLCQEVPQNSLFRRLNVTILSQEPKIVELTVGVFASETSNKLLYENSVTISY